MWPRALSTAAGFVFRKIMFQTKGLACRNRRLQRMTWVQNTVWIAVETGEFYRLIASRDIQDRITWAVGPFCGKDVSLYNETGIL